MGKIQWGLNLKKEAGINLLYSQFYIKLFHFHNFSLETFKKIFITF